MLRKPENQTRHTAFEIGQAAGGCGGRCITGVACLGWRRCYIIKIPLENIIKI